VADVEAGAANMVRQIANVRMFGVPVVVALNTFAQDHPRELAAARAIAIEAGAHGVAECHVWSAGGAGGHSPRR